MRRSLFLIAILSTVWIPCFASDNVPNFKDYSVTPETTHAQASAKLTTAQTRRYATQLREAQKHPVDFAGNFVMASWGCGAGCVMAAAINATTGAVTMLPFTVSDWPLDVTEPLSYRKDSSLLVVRGCRSEKGKGTYYYNFDGKRFRLLKAVEE